MFTAAPESERAKLFMLWMGGAYALSTVSHVSTSQSCVNVSSRVRKRADSAVLWLCYAAPWCSMNNSTIRCSSCLINNKGEETTVFVYCVKGKFIMTASVDTNIIIWDLKGEVLASINTNQMTNSHAAISPCGRLVLTHTLDNINSTHTTQYKQYTYIPYTYHTHYTIHTHTTHTLHNIHTYHTLHNINTTHTTPYIINTTHIHRQYTRVHYTHSTHTQH